MGSPLLYFIDESCSFLVDDDVYIIAHSHRVGASDALQTEITFDFTFNESAVFGFYLIPASCIFND